MIEIQNIRVKYLMLIVYHLLHSSVMAVIHHHLLQVRPFLFVSYEIG